MNVYSDFTIPAFRRHVTALCKAVSLEELLIWAHDGVPKNDQLTKTISRMTIIAQRKTCFNPTLSLINLGGPSWD
jgi:hypothetical protein